MRQAALGLGFILIASCSGSTETDGSETGSSAAAAGEEAESGRSSSPSGGSKNRGGAAGSAGPSSGGSSTGGISNGGAAQGGTAQGGASAQAGDAGESMGEGGAASGSGGSVSGTGGTAVAGSGGGDIVAPVCDPATGELDNTPYPNCEPRDATNACELCIQANCCEESKVCYGYDPGNVCGWGGPTTGDYAGLSEIDCFVLCAREYVAENLAYDDYTADVCVPACTTSACGLIGNATLDLVVCLNANCEDECFGQP